MPTETNLSAAYGGKDTISSSSATSQLDWEGRRLDCSYIEKIGKPVMCFSCAE